MWRNVTTAGSSISAARAPRWAAFAATLIALAIGAATTASAQDATAPIAEAPAAAAPAAGASIAAVASPAALATASASLAAAEPAPSALPSSATSPGGSLAVAPAAASASAPPNMVDTPSDANAVPPSTTEIPVATDLPTVGSQNVSVPAPAATSSESYNPEIARYEEEQSGISNQQQLRNLSEFLSEGEITSPIGLGLKEARRKLTSGQEADGLLVVEVRKGSPAASAGLHAYNRVGKNVATAVAMAAAVAVMPPAALLIPLIDAVPVGESYAMIIGVDGTRVSNFLDFQDRMQNLKPGETVYFSIVRNGHRMQVAVAIPKDTSLSTF